MILFFLPPEKLCICKITSVCPLIDVVVLSSGHFLRPLHCFISTTSTVFLMLLLECLYCMEVNRVGDILYTVTVNNQIYCHVLKHVIPFIFIYIMVMAILDYYNFGISGMKCLDCRVFKTATFLFENFQDVYQYHHKTYLYRERSLSTSRVLGWSSCHFLKALALLLYCYLLLLNKRVTCI